jgi:hypothetical protein
VIRPALSLSPSPLVESQKASQRQGGGGDSERGMGKSTVPARDTVGCSKISKPGKERGVSRPFYKHSSVKKLYESFCVLISFFSPCFQIREGEAKNNNTMGPENFL